MLKTEGSENTLGKPERFRGGGEGKSGLGLEEDLSGLIDGKGEEKKRSDTVSNSKDSEKPDRRIKPGVRPFKRKMSGRSKSQT